MNPGVIMPHRFHAKARSESSKLLRLNSLFTHLFVALLILTSHASSHAAIVATEDVFLDTVGSEWVMDQWSQDDAVAVQSTHKRSGTSAVSATLAPWGALCFDRRDANWNIDYLQPGDFTHVSFWVSTGTSYHSGWESIVLSLDNNSDDKSLSDYVTISEGNTWYEVRVPIADLNDANEEFFRIVFWNGSDGSGIPVFVDDVLLELDDSVTPPPPPPPPGIGDPVTAAIQASVTSPISPYIYGINAFGANERFANHSGLLRSGGNRWSAYNWENNASNAGSDYIHSSDNYILWAMGLENESAIPGRAPQACIENAVSHDCAALITIPILDYVAADMDGSVPESQTPSGPGITTNSRWNVNLPRKGSALFSYPPDLTDKYVYQDEMIYWIENTAFPAASRTHPIFYSLDNEPALWASTHSRNHPNPATYAEMVSKTVAFASMIKDLVPDSVVFGPVTYGWNAMVSLQDAPDASDRDFISFYLSSMQQAHQSAGKRLVDVLDIHWYPEALGGGTRISELLGTNLNANQIEGVVQAPRSYWDEAYEEDSWISDFVSGGYNGRSRIALIPRLKDQIADQYPGTKIAITEYVSGGDLHIAGGIAQADNLGIFGREGVFAATYWPLIDAGDYDDSYSFGAYASYINYDGSGAKVGDLSAQSVTSDHVRTSVYSMRSSSENDRMWIIAINKTADQVPLRIILNDAPAAFNRWEVYCLKAGNPDPQHVADYSMAEASIGYLMPALSVTTIELSTQGGGVPPPPLPGDNHAPVMAQIGNQTVQSGQTLQIAIHATDEDPGAILDYTATGTN